jgi:threonine synthase
MLLTNTKFDLRCARCKELQAEAYSPFCQRCGSLTEAYYDIQRVRLRDSDNPFERYFDLIPVLDKDLLPKTAKMTPTVHAKTLGELLGLRHLYLKDETAHPTGTTKYRMAAVSLPYLYESGVTEFCTSSTGNSSTAYANLIHHIPDLRMHLFTGDAFRNRVNYQPSSQITHYILHGASFAEAFNAAAQFAQRHGYTSERGFFNLGRREGLKLAWFESIEQVAAPIDWYVQAVSSAMGVYGVYKAAKESMALGLTKQLPKLLCAQQESCSPMVNAWQAGSETIQPEHVVSNPTGIAKAILRGDPTRVYPYMREIVKESRGTFLSASEQEIKEARELVLNLEGIDICYSASTAVAAVIKLAGRKTIDKNEKILINLTGSDRSYKDVPQDVTHLYKNMDAWVER